jgi:hypothetical protein
MSINDYIDKLVTNEWHIVSKEELSNWKFMVR